MPKKDESDEPDFSKPTRAKPLRRRMGLEYRGDFAESDDCYDPSLKRDRLSLRRLARYIREVKSALAQMEQTDQNQ